MATIQWCLFELFTWFSNHRLSQGQEGGSVAMLSVIIMILLLWHALCWFKAPQRHKEEPCMLQYEEISLKQTHWIITDVFYMFCICRLTLRIGSRFRDILLWCFCSQMKGVHCVMLHISSVKSDTLHNTRIPAKKKSLIPGSIMSLRKQLRPKMLTHNTESTFLTV